MDLGFLTKFSEEQAALAAEIGFTSLEVHDSSWDAEQVRTKTARKKTAEQVGEILDRHGIRISALSHYDVTVLERPLGKVKSEFGRALDLCEVLGVKVLAAMAGRIRGKSLDENIPQFRKVFGEVAKMASDRGVKIAFENWPGLGGYPLTGKNIAFTPDAWDRMFDAVKSKALGLEFDPSHLYWQGIDHIAILREFGDRVYHVHAKDTEVREDVLGRSGIYGTGWWRYVIPGLGRIDWAEFISTLNQVGFTGGIAIEHEDRIYQGKRFAEGLEIGRRHLAQFMSL